MVHETIGNAAAGVVTVGDRTEMQAIMEWFFNDRQDVVRAVLEICKNLNKEYYEGRSRQRGKETDGFNNAFEDQPCSTERPMHKVDTNLVR